MASALADGILAVHFLYVWFVVLSVPVIIIGRLLGRPFVHHSWFRNIHLAMIAVVALEGWFGCLCPLTTWENALRGDDRTADQATFVERMIRDLLFIDVPQEQLDVYYVYFGITVVALYILVPPNWLRRLVGRTPASRPIQKPHPNPRPQRGESQ